MAGLQGILPTRFEPISGGVSVCGWIYESLRRQGNVKEALLCAWGICRDGRKVLLHLKLDNKESTVA